MKVRDSGMPSEHYWESLHDVPAILDAFGFGPDTGDVVEMGCGYGTFTLPPVKRIRGTVHTLDIDSSMVARTRARTPKNLSARVVATVRDAFIDGLDVPTGSCEACLLFNILHTEEPHRRLLAARACVRPGGLVAIIHWRSDVPTPRGPPLVIRPSPEQIEAWARDVGGFAPSLTLLTLPPWHFGVALRRSHPG